MLTNLKVLRTKKGISQQQLASVIHVSQQSINKYENHDVEPNLDTLCALADYFNVSIDYIVGRTDIDRKIEHTSFCDLSDVEIKLIDHWRRLLCTDQQTVLDLTERLLK